METLLTVQEFLACKPLHKSTVLAGWMGCGRPVAALVEFQDIQALSNGYLVLIKSSELEAPGTLAAIDACLEAGVGGILLESGFVIAEGTAVKAVADQKQIPLVILPEEANREMAASLFTTATRLKQDGSLYNMLEGISLDEYYEHILKELPAVLDELQAYLTNPVALVSPFFELLAWGENSQYAPAVIAQWVNNIYSKDYCRKPREVKTDISAPVASGSFAAAEGKSAVYYVLPLALAGNVHGMLLVFAMNKPVSPMDVLRLRQTGLICLRTLVNQKQHQELEEKYKSQLMYDLLYNNFENTETLVLRAAAWGWDFSRSYQLLVLAVSADALPAAKGSGYLSPVLSAVSAVMRVNGIGGIACELMGKIIVLLPDVESGKQSHRSAVLDIASKIQQQVSLKVPAARLSAGVGRFYPASGELCRAYQEAKQALELGRFVNNASFVTFFEELGAIRLLASVNGELLDDYYKEYLNALVEYDEKNGSNLLETLQVYFKQNADLNQTAERLFMHTNTLRYRLKKIEELLDIDLQRFDNRLNLYLACKIDKMRKASP